MKRIALIPTLTLALYSVFLSSSAHAQTGSTQYTQLKKSLASICTIGSRIKENNVKTLLASKEAFKNARKDMRDAGAIVNKQLEDPTNDPTNPFTKAGDAFTSCLQNTPSLRALNEVPKKLDDIAASSQALGDKFGKSLTKDGLDRMATQCGNYIADEAMKALPGGGDPSKVASCVKDAFQTAELTKELNDTKTGLKNTRDSVANTKIGADSFNKATEGFGKCLSSTTGDLLSGDAGSAILSSTALQFGGCFMATSGLEDLFDSFESLEQAIDGEVFTPNSIYNTLKSCGKEAFTNTKKNFNYLERFKAIFAKIEADLEKAEKRYDEAFSRAKKAWENLDKLSKNNGPIATLKAACKKQPKK